ncbi:NifB/NifX family molybdenum-iron cluster-binding protein [Luteococcus sp. H138]|uniref:NifB/NifX family molybdenum-iron cluster-binding protein n=1 Tax=unclassified Luteococcus TaxID=2639923 RepID=UPI00313CEDD4
MIVATPTTADGQSATSWGKAHWVGVAEFAPGAEGPEVRAWQIHEVAWDESHDAGTHGSHHARIVRFLKDQGVQAVVVDHMGDGMRRVMNTMGIPLLPASPGDAQASVLAAVAAATN